VRGLLAIIVPLLLLAAACSGSGASKDVTISLRIEVWQKGTGKGKPVRRWRLQCNPLGGDLPHGDRACYELAVTSRPFAPVPPDAVCAQVYGGPQVASVRGHLRGRTVEATFSRTDGCETMRWDRVAFLFPVPTSSSR
jgi:hypothetical protein